MEEKREKIWMKSESWIWLQDVDRARAEGAVKRQDEKREDNGCNMD